MKYSRIVEGKFLSRPNRFIAKVEVEGKTETVHVKNTGRCRELLVPGAKVFLEDFRWDGNCNASCASGSMDELTGKTDCVSGSMDEGRKNSGSIAGTSGSITGAHCSMDHGSCGTTSGSGSGNLTHSKPQRKTLFDLVAVEKITERGPVLINMDSQSPNKAVLEWIKNGGLLKELPAGSKITFVKPEYTLGDSRFDFYVEYERDDVARDESRKGENNTVPAISSHCLQPEHSTEHHLHRLLLEVKGVTLENEGHAMFPDAPTIRGVKHLTELAELAENACDEQTAGAAEDAAGKRNASAEARENAAGNRNSSADREQTATDTQKTADSTAPRKSAETFAARSAGVPRFECAVFFVIQMKGCTSFEPNRQTHPEFAEALEKAKASGVKILVYDCRITPDSMVIEDKLNYK